MSRISHELLDMADTFGLSDAVEFDDLKAELEANKPNYTAEQIKVIRERDDISQSQFALMLNVSTKTVQNWEQGVKPPNSSAMRLIEIIDHQGYFGFYKLFN